MKLAQIAIVHVDRTSSGFSLFLTRGIYICAFKSNNRMDLMFRMNEYNKLLDFIQTFSIYNLTMK